MNHRSQRPKSRETVLWKRILERYRFRGRLLPTRVPLVFLRAGLPKQSHEHRARSQRNGFPVQLNLHFQLSWPQWLVTRHEPRVAFHTHSWRRSVEGAIATSSLSIIRSLSLPVLTSSKSVRDFSWLISGPKTINTPASSVSKTIRQFSERVERNLEKILPGAATVVFPLSKTPVNNRLHTVSVAPQVFADLGSSSVQRIPAAHSRKFTADAFHTTVAQRSLRHDTVERALRVNSETRSVATLTVQPQLVHRARTDEIRSNSSAPARSQQSNEQQSPTPARTPTSVVQPVQPQLDMNRLSDEVYRHIQRKIRIERERRGL